MEKDTNLVSYEGCLESISFSSPETNFMVGHLHCGEEFITIIGIMLAVNVGAKLKVFGNWESHSKYGKQFHVKKFEVILPQSAHAMESYLSAHAVKGIGPKMAKKLVAHFGDKLWDILNNAPEEIKRISGIGSKNYEMILSSWRSKQGNQQALIQLADHGIYGSKAAKIINHYGGNALAILHKYPYRLALDIDGIGFLTADEIARKLGLDVDNPERIQAGFLHVLSEAEGKGHCYLPQEELIKITMKLLKLEEAVVERGLEMLLSKESFLIRLEDSDQPIYSRYLYHSEFVVAKMLETNADSATSRTFPNQDSVLKSVQKELNITFVEEQCEAVQQALLEKICIITGGPGVGKTTVIKALVRILEKSGYKFALAAPTGRAAKRLSETSGFPASTIHRLLKYNPHGNYFEYDSNNPLQLDHVIIDETSMLDIHLAYHLLRAIFPKTHITFVGDADQLPSVGPGNFLSDLIQSRVFSVVQLKHIFRQAQGSTIIHVAHAINFGIMPKITNQHSSDIFFMPVDSSEAGADLIVDLVTRRLPTKYGLDAKNDIQVIVPMYRGTVGADRLNQRLADAINPAGKQVLHRFLREGDKVMQIVNNYDKDVYNGDIGIIVEAPREKNESTRIDFGNNRLLEYKPAELDNIVRSYAISIHKSQGSEYPCVVIPLFTEHYIMLERNLLYTAITRGKKLVVLVGSKEAMRIAIRNVHALNRYTRLVKYLGQGIDTYEEQIDHTCIQHDPPKENPPSSENTFEGFF